MMIIGMFVVGMILVLMWMAIRPTTSRVIRWPHLLRPGAQKKKKDLSRVALRRKDEHPLAGSHLESKVGFETQETTSHLHDEGEGEAFSHLENCLRRVEKQFFPAHHDMPSKLLGDTLIDQRVFWDLFKNESGTIVALYHVDEMRVVFVSASVKRLLGFPPQDFRIRFHELLHDMTSWKKQLYQLRWRKRLYVPLAFKEGGNKSGSICAWDGYLAQLDKGQQAQYAVLVLYPAYCYLSRPV